MRYNINIRDYIIIIIIKKKILVFINELKN